MISNDNSFFFLTLVDVTVAIYAGRSKYYLKGIESRNSLSFHLHTQKCLNKI
jgi:hypothetical protein